MWKTIVPQKGDLIRVKRPLYYHFGIYIGNNKVIHFAGYHGDQSNEPDKIDVHEAPIEDFIRGDVMETYVREEKDKHDAYSRRVVIKRAKKGIGEKGYSLIHNNCEHFAYRCYFKVAPKSQSDIVIEKVKKIFHKK